MADLIVLSMLAVAGCVGTLAGLVLAVGMIALYARAEEWLLRVPEPEVELPKVPLLTFEPAPCGSGRFACPNPDCACKVAEHA